MEKILPKFALALVALAAAPAFGQFRVAPGFRGGMMRAMPAAAAQPAETKNPDDPDSKFPDGPALKTDPEAQQLLQRAEQFVKDERFDLASVLWQKVLDDAGDNLVSVDGRVYISLRRQVEQRLAELPRLALSTYRVTADGEAQALLSAAGPDKEEQALADVVRRFFLSSHGDEAAYKLGCLALDRYDFVGASRLFLKVLEEHPDPSVPKADLLVRLAVAAGRVGDREAADKFLADIEALEGPKPSRTLLGAVSEDIAQSTVASQYVSARLAMPALPGDATSKTLTALWSQEYEMRFQEQPLGRNMAYMYSGRMAPVEQRQISREQVIDRWKQNGWMPAGKLLFADGRVFFKTGKNLTCWSTKGEDKVLWETLWNNEYEVDEFSQQLAMMAMNMGMQPGMQSDQRPRTPAEMLLFGDRIHQDISIAGGRIYSIEGRRYPKNGQPDSTTRQPKPFNWNSTPRRTRVNWLAAYDIRTGKVQWHRAADDEAKDGSDGGMGFMAAPVACGSVLLAPATDGGSMWLLGIAPDDGRTLWKTYLCDEPAGGCDPWSPIKVAVEGRDAYVLCGAGVVFAVDGTTGAIRWVVRYQRDKKSTSTRMVMRGGYGGAARLEDYDGWSEEMLVPVGRQLLVMASDSAWLFSLDCRSGEFLWRSPRTTGGAASYCIGVKGRAMFVGGTTQVRRVDIPSGKIVWEYPKEGPAIESYGRAVLTDDALYVPVKDSVLKLDPETGLEVSQVGVRLTSHDPVGNLYSDGEKLWVLSANRFYSLTHLEYLMKSLEKRIEEGDSGALLDRMRLLVKSEEWDAAMSDLRNAYVLIRQQKDRDSAAAAVFTTLDELKLSSQRPTVVLAALTELFADDAAALKPEQRVKLEGMLASALAAIPRKKSPGIAQNVLAAAPLMRQDFLVHSAAKVLKSAATSEDQQALAAAVQSGQEPASVIAAEAWAMVDPDSARVALRPWLGSGDAKIKLLTARALLQAGDTMALQSLIELLDHADLSTRIRSYQALRAATAKNDLPFTAYAPAAERTKQAQGWKEWYAASKDSIKLTLPLPETGTQLGRTLVCSHGRNQIVELDANFKEIGKRPMAQVWSAKGLPDGNRLVGSTQQNRVVEYDDKWNEKWSVDGLPSGVYGIDRSIDGNTIVACADAGPVPQVLEITPNKEKKVLWKGDGSGRPVFVRRLENGNTLISLQGSNKVIEVDATGKQVWEASTPINPYSAQRLENGNTLVAAMIHGANGTIVEIDRAGRQTKIVKQGLRNVYAAERLENGNLLYADILGLHEIDPEGKSIFSRRENGITGFSRF